jgi:hypothetical protein
MVFEEEFENGTGISIVTIVERYNDRVSRVKGMSVSVRGVMVVQIRQIILKIECTFAL